MIYGDCYSGFYWWNWMGSKLILRHGEVWGMGILHVYCTREVLWWHIVQIAQYTKEYYPFFSHYRKVDSDLKSHTTSRRFGTPVEILYLILLPKLTIAMLNIIVLWMELWRNGTHWVLMTNTYICVSELVNVDSLSIWNKFEQMWNRLNYLFSRKGV